MPRMSNWNCLLLRGGGGAGHGEPRSARSARRGAGAVCWRHARAALTPVAADRIASRIAPTPGLGQVLDLPRGDGVLGFDVPLRHRGGLRHRQVRHRSRGHVGHVPLSVSLAAPARPPVHPSIRAGNSWAGMRVGSWCGTPPLSPAHVSCQYPLLARQHKR